MSYRILPILFFNLGGEMMYILDQRLIAQRIPKDRAIKILNDIAKTMFNKKFVEDLFHSHQPLYNKGVLRAMFDKLAHASIMRLNKNSMEKLYDLMAMAVKFQFLSCRHPKEILGITLNHLDAIRTYICQSEIIHNVRSAHELLVESYSNLPTGQIQAVRYAVLNFFQDLKVRVSVFLNEGVQRLDGSFKFDPNSMVPKECVIAGEIVYFEEGCEPIDKTSFFPGMEYEHTDSDCATEWQYVGRRGTLLGTNMYYAEYNLIEREVSNPEKSPKGPKNAETVLDAPLASKNLMAKEELNLLAKLLACSPDKQILEETIPLNLFPNKNERSSESKKQISEVYTYGRETPVEDEELCKIINDLKTSDEASSKSPHDSEDNNDILTLLDEAN